MVEMFSLKYVLMSIQNNVFLFLFVLFLCPTIWMITRKPYSKRVDKKVNWVGGAYFGAVMLIALFLYLIFCAEPVKEVLSRNSFYRRFSSSFSAIMLCVIICFPNWCTKLFVKLSNKKATPTEEPSIDSKMMIAFLAMSTLIIIGFRVGIDDYINIGITMILGFFVSLQFLLGDKASKGKVSLVEIVKRKEVIFSIVLDALFVFISPFDSGIIITMSTGLLASCVFLGIILIVIRRKSKS